MSLFFHDAPLLVMRRGVLDDIPGGAGCVGVGMNGLLNDGWERNWKCFL
jgi:hypothetical protein